MPAVSMLTTEGTTALVIREYSSFRRDMISTSLRFRGARVDGVKASELPLLFFRKEEIRDEKSPPVCHTLRTVTKRKKMTNTKRREKNRLRAGGIGKLMCLYDDKGE